MPPPRQHHLIKRTLRRFRLVTAKAISRNMEYLVGYPPDMLDIAHINELCDTYCLRICLNWLATKYGFPAYRSDMHQNKNNVLFPLETWPALSYEYPFSCSEPAKDDSDLWLESFQVLDSLPDYSTHILGTLYEYISDGPIDLDDNHRCDIPKARIRNLNGQFYTPPWVVSYTFNTCLDEDSARLMKRIKSTIDTSKHQPSGAADRFRILDPACGTGNFLLGAVEWAAHNGLSQKEAWGYVERCLYGIDTDGRALSLARLALVVTLSGSVQNLRREHNSSSVNDQLHILMGYLRRHLVVSDSVMAAAALPIELDQNRTNSMQKDCINDEFSLVITNPPYISYGSRNHRQPPKSWLDYLKKCYGASTEYKIRLYSVFQEIALRYAGNHGLVALFVPDAFLTGRYYQKLRREILRVSHIKSLSELPDNLIDGAVVGRWCIACYRKTGRARQQTSSVELHRFDRWQKKPTASYSVPLEILVSPDRNRFRLIFCDTERSIWSRMDELEAIGQSVRGHTGLRGRMGQSSIVSSECIGETWRPGLTSGSEVTRHCLKWRGNWLNLDRELLWAGGYDPKIIERPKLLVRQTGDRIIAACDENHLYHLNNLHTFTVPDAANLSALHRLYFFAGLLNSSFYLFLYRSKTREGGCALAQIDIETIEAMPMARRREDLEHDITYLSRQISHRRGQEFASGHTNNTSVLSSMERAIDRLVYQLYDLSSVEVEYIENLSSIKSAIHDFHLPDLEEARHLARSCFAFKEHSVLTADTER